ncbi:hypothetical protein IWX47DRAFT_141317 [Phyllosticta citricarpa]
MGASQPPLFHAFAPEPVLQTSRRRDSRTAARRQWNNVPACLPACTTGPRFAGRAGWAWLFPLFSSLTTSLRPSQRGSDASARRLLSSLLFSAYVSATRQAVQTARWQDSKTPTLTTTRHAMPYHPRSARHTLLYHLGLKVRERDEAQKPQPLSCSPLLSSHCSAANQPTNQPKHPSRKTGGR